MKKLNKNKKIFIIVSIFVAVIAIFAFISKNDEVQPEIEPPSVVTPGIVEPKNEEVIIELKSGKVTNKDDTILIDYSIFIPKSTEFMKKPFKLNFDTYYDNIFSKIDEYMLFEAYDNAEYRLENDGENFLNSKLEMNTTISLNNQNILSVVRETIEYSGGNSTSIKLASETFTKDDGLLNTLGDVVSDIDFIKKYVIENINGHNLFENYEENIDEAFNPQQFYLTEKEVVIYFNSYEIAPASEGYITIKIPYSDILDILTDNYKNLGE